MDIAEQEPNSATYATLNDLLLSQFTAVRGSSNDLCQPLETEDYVVQPVTEVSPPKWHLAHTSWFFEEVILSRYLPGYQRFDPHFGTLFNSYYKSVGRHWIQGERGQLSRPTVSEVFRYRAYVDLHMEALLQGPEIEEELKQLIILGLHHEQQHQELLLMDIKYILAVNPCLPVYDSRDLPRAEPIAPEWREYPGRLAEIGPKGDSFCFDNEMPRHQALLNDHAIALNLVTNGEYLAFMADGGYRQPSLWLSEGWDWVLKNQIDRPLYWKSIEGENHEFTLHGLQKLDPNAPVCHVSYYEADAFARWRQCRLPTEFELEHFLQESLPSKHRPSPLYHPLSAAEPTGQLWCWSSSHYSPYPGFKPFAGMAAEYNGKFMCSQFVLRGGCVATPAGHYRPSYRNFFGPSQRWMFSGIRLAR